MQWFQIQWRNYRLLYHSVWVSFVACFSCVTCGFDAQLLSNKSPPFPPQLAHICLPIGPPLILHPFPLPLHPCPSLRCLPVPLPHPRHPVHEAGWVGLGCHHAQPPPQASQDGAPLPNIKGVSKKLSVLCCIFVKISTTSSSPFSHSKTNLYLLARPIYSWNYTWQSIWNI